MKNILSSRILLVIPFLNLYLVCNSQIPVFTTDSLALVSLYNSTNGTNWTNNTNWLNGSIITWYGVTLENDRIISVRLNDNNLSGAIPSEIGNLSNLQSLYLQNNQLTGSIPHEIGNLSNLRELELSDNQLTGNIPTEIANLANLQGIYLYANQLSGSIPPEVCQLTNLQVLYLSNNQLTGNIPTAIGNLTNLQTLYLGNNQLFGSIPSQIGNLLNLQYLYLTNGQLTGNLPPEIGNLSNLKELYLSSNHFSGCIPPEIGNLSSLQVMFLGGSQFTGGIPPEIGNLSNLQKLYLYNDQLTGSIPTEIGNLTNLKYLYLHDNQLTGSIPHEIGNMSNLQYLYLPNNQLSGNIPSEIGSLINLLQINLFKNQFNGSIPQEIVNLLNLNMLELSYCQLEGLPALNSLKSLNNLSVAANKFTFEDIEPNIGFAPSFTYSPQDSVCAKQYISLAVGDNSVLSVSVGGINNVYQWSKDGVLLSGEQKNTLEIFNAALSDEGIYTCQITNTVATELTLHSRPITVSVTIANNNPYFSTSPVTSVNEDSPYLYTCHANDADGDELTYSAPTKPSWLNFNDSTRVLSGTPSNSNVGTHNLILRVTDGKATVDQVFTITVANVNDAPVITSFLAQTATEDSPYLDTLVVTDIDLGDIIYYNGTNIPEWLTFNNLTHILSGTPRNADVGAHNVDIWISDGTEILYYSFTITVTNINDAPVFTSTPVTSVNEDSPYSYNCYASDEDLGATLEYSALIKPSWLTFNTITRILSGIPDNNNVGTHNVTLRATDGISSVNQSFTISVANVNDAPIISGQNTISLAEDNTRTITIADLIISDPDNSMTEMSVSLGNGSNYTVSGGKTLLPDANYFGTLTVPVTINDGHANSNTFNIAVTVTPVNDAPVITGQTVISINEDNSFFINPTDLIIFDPDNIHFTVNAISGTNYSVTGGNEIHPSANFFGTIVVPVTINDGAISSNTFNVNATILSVNDAPIVNDIPDQDIELGDIFTAIQLDDYVSDIETPYENIIWSYSGNSHLIVSIDNRVATITIPSENWIGSENLAFTAFDNDATTPLSGSDKVTFIVTHENFAPVISQIPDQSIDEGGSFDAIHIDEYVEDNATAAQNIVWSYSGNTNLQINIVDGIATITIPDENWNGSETIIFKATDVDPVNVLSDQDTVKFTINAVNDAPVVSAIPNQTIDEDETFAVINLDNFVSDIETSDNEITWTYSGNTHLQVTITNRIATITIPDINWNGSETIIFKATDAYPVNALSDQDTVRFTITAVNDAPIVSVIPDQTIKKGESFEIINLDDYVYDIETSDDAISWTYSGNINLAVSINNRKASITVIDEAWIGSESIIFTASDSDAAQPLSDNKTADFRINPLTLTAEFSDIEQISIYPNPTFGMLFITTQNMEESGIIIEIISIDGQIINIDKQVNNTENILINMDNLSNGTYIIKVSTSKMIHIFKICKN